MKKVFILFVLMLATSVEFLHASNTKVNGLWYNFDDNTQTAEVTYRGSSYDYYANEYSGEIVIPASVERNGIPYSVTSIDEGAFYGCDISSIDIPNSVKSIGDYAFFGCVQLSNLICIANVFAHMPTSYSGTYVIPEGTETILSGAFYGCSGLNSVTIPNSVTSIGDRAFEGCSSLVSVTIPKSVTSIGTNAFNNNTKVFPEDGVYLAERDLSKDTLLAYAVLNNDEDMYMSYLLNITEFANSRVDIKNYFQTSWGWQAQVKLTAGNTVQNKVLNIFKHNDFSYVRATIESGRTTSKSGIGSFFAHATTSTKNQESNSITDSLGYTGYKLGGEDNFLAIQLTGDTFALGDRVYIYVTQNSDIGNYLYLYGDMYGDYLIDTIPNKEQPGLYSTNNKKNGLNTICLFRHKGSDHDMNPYVAYMEINHNLTYKYSVDFNALQGTVSYRNGRALPLEEITFTATPNYGYHFSEWSDGNTDNPRTITLTQDTSFTAEFAVDRSGKCGDDLALTWEYEPASKTLTISGEGALNNNYTYGLEAPDEAEKLVIEEGVTSIDHGAFYYCGTGCSWSQLKSVSIPTSVTHIAGKAINGVNEIHYTGTIEQWCAKSWTPSSLSYSGYSLFMADTLVTDLVIPGNVDTIENEVFSRCLSLKTITISEGVDTIQNPFYYCQNLVHVTMPHSIKGIEGKAFAGCDKLEAIYVPCGDLPRFKRIFYGYHSDKLQYEPLPYSISVNTTGNGDATFVRDDSICENYLLTAIPATNHHFVHWNDGNTENPRIIKLMQDTTLTAEFAVDRSGKCGDKWALNWEYDVSSKSLTISGNGSLNNNYTFGVEAPTDAVKLIISEGVTSIGNNAFSNYSTLQEISFPTTISTIGEQAFYQCTGLKHIYNYRERPCVAYSNTFDGIDKFECTLHVLSASVDMYRVATGWRDFYYITTIETTNIENVQNIKGHNTKIFQNDQIVILRGDKTYTLQGQEIIVP